ncbi:uncharacterized protein LOC136027925 isoform X4 [Artemia franciscana]|uniref:uncharacterized protein LOC136027925 isoform X4 n=1 Tax=Artemia franciscana TaxID=6661 RepID=UPI0032DA8663
MVLDTPRPPQVRETQNDSWQDVREGGETGEVFDGGALVEGSGQVIVANHCCCLMCPQAWEDLSLRYLDDCDCKESCRIFLRESPDLEERRAFVSRGISPTSDLGICLIDIFEDYFETKEIFTNLLSKVPRDLLGKVRRNDSLSTITRQMVKLVPKSNSVIRQVSGGYSYKSGLRRSRLETFTAPKRDLPSKRRGRRLEDKMNGRDTNPPEASESIPNEVLITLLPPLPQTSSEQPSLRSLSRLETPDFTQEQGATEAKNERNVHTGSSLDFDTVLNAATIPQEGVSVLPSFSQKIESSPTQKELTLPSENFQTFGLALIWL